MLSIERQSKIVEMARERHLVKVTELMERFGVSDMTVRRDLDALEKRGILKKVYGGAVLAQSVSEPDQDIAMDVRSTSNLSLKQEIARQALQFIENDDVLLFDAGTTTLEVARVIQPRQDLVVVTNSLPIAYELMGKVSSVLLAGGNVRALTYSTVGPKTKEFLADLHVNKLFLGASSLSLDQGLMNSNLYESEIKRLMMANANQVILLADSSKFQSRSYHVFAKWTEVDVLVTDHLLAEDVTRRLTEQGVHVRIADKPEHVEEL